MTIVNTATGEITETLDKVAARRLTDRIRLLAETVAEQVEKMAGLIDEARTGSAWLALGYASWTAYIADEFGGIMPRLDREPRQEFVRELAERGMSTRSIAPLVGMSKSAVDRDLQRVPDGTRPPVIDTMGRTQPSTKSPQGQTPSNDSAVAAEDVESATTEPHTPQAADPAVSTAAALAIAEFPDLVHYVSDEAKVLGMAKTLRSVSGRRQEEHLASLRASIALEEKRAAEPDVVEEDPTDNAERLFYLANEFNQVAATLGGVEAIAAAMPFAVPLEADLWRDEFAALITTATDLHAATKPGLRRIK